MTSKIGWVTGVAREPRALLLGVTQILSMKIRVFNRTKVRPPAGADCGSVIGSKLSKIAGRARHGAPLPGFSRGHTTRTGKALTNPQPYDRLPKWTLLERVS